MIRRLIPLTIAATAMLSLASVASAQWGYWGGWHRGGSTIGGDLGFGMGVLAEGMGSYNLSTAQAASINADTGMRMNEYLWQSQQISRQRHMERVARRRNLNTELLKEMEQRQLYNPSNADIDSGDALNAMLFQLSNPSVPSSIVENAGSDLTLAADDVRKVPLKFASQGVVISAHRLAAEEQWPAALRTEAFQNERQAYRNLVEEAQNTPDDEPIPPGTIDKGIAILQQMREKARASLAERQFVEAERFLKGQIGLLQMAREPNIQAVLEQLRGAETVPLANTLGFMQAYNLQFGRADDPEERMLYRNVIYPRMADLRDRVANELGGEIPGEIRTAGRTPDVSPTELFHGLDWDVVTGQRRDAAPPEAEQPEQQQ